MSRSPNKDIQSPGIVSPKVQSSIRAFMHSGSNSPPKAQLKRAATSDDALGVAEPASAAEMPARKRTRQAGSHSQPTPAAAAKQPTLTKAQSTGTSARGVQVDTSVEGKAAPGNPNGVVSKLVDALHGEDLLVMFVGVNPGIRTAEKGHAYAHPSNHYWRLLHASGLTPRLCVPSETHALVEWLRYGNTNLVARATKDASTLSRAELDAGVADIEAKARRVRARVVCLVGKGIWEAVERVWRARARPVARFQYGFRPDKERLGADPANYWPGSRVFVATTTSALAANMSWDQKLDIWRQLGDWVAEERKREAAEAEEEEEEGEGTDAKDGDSNADE